MFGLMYVLVYFIFIDKAYGILQLFIFLSIPVLSLYNGKAGNNKIENEKYRISIPLIAS